MLIGCDKEQQATKALKLEEVAGVKVVSNSKVGSGLTRNRGRRGVIRGIPLNLSVEGIKNNMKGRTITDILGMKSIVNGTRIQTLL